MTGGVVEATILTAHHSLRQTLSMAVEEVARRLRSKGRVFAMASPKRGRGFDEGQAGQNATPR
jgi:hypothetical protein